MRPCCMHNDITIVRREFIWYELGIGMLVLLLRYCCSVFSNAEQMNIMPIKNKDWINKIGSEAAERFNSLQKLRASGKNGILMNESYQYFRSLPVSCRLHIADPLRRIFLCESARQCVWVRASMWTWTKNRNIPEKTGMERRKAIAARTFQMEGVKQYDRVRQPASVDTTEENLMKK